MSPHSPWFYRNLLQSEYIWSVLLFLLSEIAWFLESSWHLLTSILPEPKKSLKKCQKTFLDTLHYCITSRSVVHFCWLATLLAKWVQSLVGGKCWIPNNMYQTLSAETLFPSNHVEYEQLEDALIDQLLTAAKVCFPRRTAEIVWLPKNKRKSGRFCEINFSSHGFLHKGWFFSHGRLR